jgi:hypothetical protein
LERLHAALDGAAGVPAAVERAAAADWLDRMLAAPVSGVITVVWHSLVWQYLDDQQRERVTAALAAAGRAATPSAPLAHVALEPDRNGKYEVWLTRWPGGVARLIAHSEDHGIPTTWL